MKIFLKKITQKIKLYNRLVKNFSYLSALQIFNMLLPLLTYPYLIRVLGLEIYGRIVFAQAVIGYLVIVVGFGFNFSAAKEVSIHRNNKEKLNEIVSSIIIIKCILFVSVSISLLVLLYFIPQAKGYEELFILTLWMCLYDVIFPIWYFQGIEKMEYITGITLITRLTFVGLIFLFIHSPEEYLLFPIINGIGAIIAGISSLFIMLFKHQVKFSFQPYRILKYYFIDSIPIFISNVSLKFYLSTSKIIVGVFLGMTEVSYYDLAEKLSLVFTTPIQIIGQTLFPKISKEKNMSFLKKSFKFSIYLSFIILLTVNFMSEFIILTIGGNEMISSIPIFRIMFLGIIPITISLYFANLALLSWGYNKDYLKIRLYAFALYAALILMLIGLKSINLYTLAIVSVIVETITAVVAIIFCNKRKINFLIQ
jgi:O-antigen/teichoic acid export membrane protein